MKTINALIVLLLGLGTAALAQPSFTISTVAGNGTAGFSGDGGPATSAEINSPYMAAVDSAGNLYIADFNNNRIRKVTPGGVISTFAGTGAAGFGGDGGPATSAKLYMPSSVFFDTSGNLFIADQFNGRVRKVTPAGIISTVAGPGPYQGYCGDGGPATSACLNGPIDGVTDANGNLYIAEFDSNAIRMVNTSGIISTVAGGNVTAGYSGDGGPATSASLSGPTGAAVSSTGDVYIADGGNNRIRKVSGGIITTVAGNGKAGYSGDGGLATAAALNFPGRVRLDAAANIYISDGRNNRIRVVSATTGTISTVAGNGTSGYTGDGGPATSAEIGAGGISVTASETVYVASNNRIRVLTPIIQPPAISTGGIVSASAFGAFPSIAPGSWIEIYGANLAIDSRSWTNADFSGVNAPTSLDGTKVTIGGQAAFIDYISPIQVNAQVPSNVATGSQQVVITTTAGTSAAYPITVNATQPGLLAPASFNIGGKQYAVVLFTDGTYVLPTGAISGITSRPAQPGDVIVLYGVGFGPVTPSIPAGQLVQQTNTLASNFQMSIGGVAAQALYSGLAPNYTGLYQFNITVPNVAPGNAVPLTFTLGSLSGTQTVYISVQN